MSHFLNFCILPASIQNFGLFFLANNRLYMYISLQDNIPHILFQMAKNQYTVQNFVWEINKMIYAEIIFHYCPFLINIYRTLVFHKHEINITKLCSSITLEIFLKIEWVTTIRKLGSKLLVAGYKGEMCKSNPITKPISLHKA